MSYSILADQYRLHTFQSIGHTEKAMHSINAHWKNNVNEVHWGQRWNPSIINLCWLFIQLISVGLVLLFFCLIICKDFRGQRNADENHVLGRKSPSVTQDGHQPDEDFLGWGWLALVREQTITPQKFDHTCACVLKRNSHTKRIPEVIHRQLLIPCIYYSSFLYCFCSCCICTSYIL